MRVALVKRIIATLCLPLVLLPAASSISQPNDSAEADAQNSSVASEDEKLKEKAKSKSVAKSKKDVSDDFIPSEEISEDLSVSFPVDI